MREEKATLGGGCFWCIEAAYNRLSGVIEAVSGYSGGAMDNPGYKNVCTGTTGHAEVVQITYDADLISYEEILEVFWVLHDPTSLNRQGADLGTQYRSVIFYHDDDQKARAEAAIKAAETHFAAPIVTELSPLKAFFPAEDYHQHYYDNNPYEGYCMVVIDPKLEKFKARFSAKLKPE